MASSFFSYMYVKLFCQPHGGAALFFSLVVRVLRALAQQVVSPVR